jgi:serine protease Do
MSALSQLSKRARGVAAAAGLALLGAAAAGAIFNTTPALALFPEDGFSAVAALALPAYVDIGTLTEVEVQGGGGGGGGGNGGPFDEFFRDFFDKLPDSPGGRQVQSQGSGFIIDPSGIVVTNNHVIDGANEVAVILNDGTRLTATVLGVDDRADLAVLKIDSEDPLPYLSWGDSDTADIGDWTIAIGNPFGLGGTLTVGIISARARNINAGPYDDFIQTDASINRGNSGGPLLNIYGQVIGINTAIFSPNGASVGIGFAIPANLASPIVDELIEYGRARRGWIGARLQNVNDEIAARLGLDSPRGALIAGVSSNGPAGAAGLQAGDVILSFGGESIDKMRTLPRVVADIEPGTTVEVGAWRDGEPISLQVMVGELTEAAVTALANLEGPVLAVDESLGLSLTGITPEVREQFGLTADAQGVLITSVEASTDAAQRGIRPGDMILEVGNQQVTSAEEVAQLVAAARNESRSSVRLLLRTRDGGERFVALSIEQG